MINELTISFKNGALTGVQVRGSDGMARGLQTGDLAEQLATVNESALLRVNALTIERVQLQAALDAYKARGLQAAQTVARILDDPAMTPEQKTTAIRAVTTDIQSNEHERQRAVALAKLAEAQAEVDKYEG